MPAALLFGRYDTSQVKVRDIGLKRYINLSPKTVPHTFGRHVHQPFKKDSVNIVERLVNKVMRSGQGKRKLSGKYIRGRGVTGNKLQALRIVRDAFAYIQAETGENPVQVLVQAIENAAPREDTTRLRRGGISYAQAVDVAPLRRLDDALKNLALAGFAHSFNNPKPAAVALAEELILASREDPKSMAVRRRNEVERIAKSSR